MEQLGSYCTDLYETCYLRIFRKLVKKIQVSIKHDKNNGYCIRRLMYTREVM